MPRFEIVNVPSSRSACWSLPPRVRSTRSARAFASSAIVLRSALRMTGTTSPCGTATANPTFAVGKIRTASPAKCAFTSRWRRSATALAFVRTSENVGLASPSCIRSTSFSRSRIAAVMSAVMAIWNAGADHASVMRRAIVLRIELNGTVSTSPGGTSAAAAATAPVPARSTSSATIRPSGPVPRSDARSIPASFARRRASGDAFTRPPSRAGAGAGCSSGAGSSRAGSGAGSSAGSSALGAEPLPLGSSGTSSPASPITAICLPTSTSPSATRIFNRIPEASASTSCVTFSVSSS